MNEFCVLNLSNDKDFCNLLKRVAQTLNISVISSIKATIKPSLVFIDVDSINFKAEHPSLHYVAVTLSSDDLLLFFEHNIFHIIPGSISESKFEHLCRHYLTLSNVRALSDSLNQVKDFAFDDFICFAEQSFRDSNRGVAFLSTDLNILTLNYTFSTYFHHIFNQSPSINRLITEDLPGADLIFWQDILDQADKFEGKEVDLYGSSSGVIKYYKMYVHPVFRELAFIGYSVKLEDISEFTKANIDLVKYYKYLLEQNRLLEEANKEIKFNNKRLKAAYEKLNALSNRDYLTQAPNRKFFLEKIEYEQLRFKRTKSPFILVYGDIDNFKRVNDDYSHETGDHVLIALTALIKTAIRNIDFFCRWGGEEFLIFLAESDIEKGRIVAERILAEIRNHTFNYHGHSIKITMTFGIALYDEDQHINKIIDLADQRLYWGKQNGKDQVVHQDHPES